MDFGLKEKDSLLVRSCSCNRYTNQTKHVCKMVLEYGQIFVQKSQIGTYNLEWFKSRPRVFRVRKRHLIATVFRRHRMRHFFSFNPKNKVTITLNEVLEFVFVTEFGTKNVIFVTIVTNRPYNLLIIKWIFRVEKSPWKVRVLLHREVINLAYLFDIQLIRLNIMFGDLRYSRRFTEFFGVFWTTFEPRVVQGR